jgi:hypothetical protein
VVISYTKADAKKAAVLVAALRRAAEQESLMTPPASSSSAAAAAAPVTYSYVLAEPGQLSRLPAAEMAASLRDAAAIVLCTSHAYAGAYAPPPHTAPCPLLPLHLVVARWLRDTLACRSAGCGCSIDVAVAAGWHACSLPSQSPHGANWRRATRRR